MLIARLHSNPRRHIAACILLLGIVSSTSHAQNAAEWNSRGADAYKAGERASAAEAFRKAYDLDRRDDTIQENLVNAIIMYAQNLNVSGGRNLAIRWLEYIVTVDPENVHPLNQLGAYLLLQGDVSSSIFRLEESIELDPDDIDAHFLLGEAYYKDNDVTAAIDQWEWVYKVDPEYGGHQEHLKNALREEQVEFDFDGESSRNFNVTFSQEAEGNLVLEILESAYRNIGKKLGGIYPPTPIQVSLYTSEGFFASTALGQHVGALYDGRKIRCPVLDKNGASIPLDILRERLTHEHVHVVVRHMVGGNIPWWFNEGLAETMSTQVSPEKKSSKMPWLIEHSTISRQYRHKTC
jgi:tetratricopeptide (TPR) repeat protein